MIDDLIKYTSRIFFLLYPLFFLTITPESYEYNKMILLILFVLVNIVLWSIKSVIEKKLTIIKSTFTAPLLLITLITIISTFLQSPNLVVALTTPLAASTIISLFIFYYLLIHTVSKEEKRVLFSFLVLDAVLISFYIFFLYTGLIPKSLFTPIGNILSTTIFLLLILVYLIATVLSTYITYEKKGGDLFDKSSEDRNIYLLYIFCSIVIAIALLLGLFHLFSDQSPILLPFQFGWTIFLEVLKNIRTLILGMGPTNFITSYTLGKPIQINQSPVWNVVFTSSSSFFLNIASETGIITSILFIYIFFKSFILLRQNLLQDIKPKNQQLPYNIVLLLSLLTLFILPGNMVLLITTYALLSITSEKLDYLEIEMSHLGKLVYVFLAPSIIIFLIASYLVGRAYLAEYYFKLSLDAIVNNIGTKAYDFQRQAIKSNPYLDRYHSAFSQTNLAIANAMASNKDLKPEDIQKIPVFVQQSIDEARSAVNLFRTNIVNWDNLAKIYTALINYAKGAENWAIQAHEQKLILDPLSPKVRLSFGGLYLGLNNFGEAENLFRHAIFLKPDLANAHYNLAIVLRRQEKYEESYKELKTTLSLVAKDSSDASRVREELALLPSTITTDSAEIIGAAKSPETLESIDILKSPLNKLPSPSPFDL